MRRPTPFRPVVAPAPGFRARSAALVALAIAAACAPAAMPPAARPPDAPASRAAPGADARIGLRAGLLDAEHALWNLRLVSSTPPPDAFVGVTNSDLAFTRNYAIQGNYNGFMVWDISNPSRPALVEGHVCPASQSDVSVYKNLLFVSGEGMSGRLDCGTQGVREAVSHDRLRGIRIFDITDIRNPKYVGNVQTCRGSHTHTVLEHPGDTENVYVYVSGSSVVRPAEELPGCVSAPPGEDPNSALFRIEVIRVPLADPSKAAIVSSPRIFEDLAAPPRHGDAPADIAAARARGGYVVAMAGVEMVLPRGFVAPLLDSIVAARGGTGAPTAADSAALRASIQDIVDRTVGASARTGPTQCHDITVYPAIGLAAGACFGYGMLLDISDPVNPRRIAAAADPNFAAWHSATFNNDGTAILFVDEWGGSQQPKCRATDPREWGANALFTLQGKELRFQSYYKLPAPQTELENCVSHNGSLIPIPGRTVMVQSWNQGGVSVFDWTDPANPVEIAFHDRGPADSTRLVNAGSWSAYWYNGYIYSSEKLRGLDVFELVPSEYISQNEIDAARSVALDEFNAQMQTRFVWPPTFALARAYADQLERSGGLAAERIAAVRRELDRAESAAGAARRDALTRLAAALEGEARGSPDAAKVALLAAAVRDLAAPGAG